MSFRVRLALWFSLVMGVLVIATSAATYLVVRSSLADAAQRHARQLARAAAHEQPREGELDRLAGPGDKIWLTDSRGVVIAASHSGRGEDTASAAGREIDHAPAGATSARWRRPGGGSAIVLVRNRTIESSLSTLLRTLLAVGAAFVAVAAVLGVILAARTLRPVERMRREVDDISGAQLDRRIAEGRSDELGRLAHAFNRLLARAERATAEQQHFVADASHELRTPVTALQGHARIVVRAIDRGDLGQARESAEVVVDESRRLAGTLAELLSLAESAGPERPLEPVRLDRVAAEACNEMRAFHPGRTVDAELAEATVNGDAGRLGELVRILADNALKYSPAEAAVSVTVTAGERPELAVRDHGPGLSATDRERAFDRFYRGTASPGVGGSGLGLAIARSVCERHGAELSLDDAPGGGTVARVRFPAVG
ncbi:MAG TPA: HAMP domain-containing sensor histidine kinase [Gaiellales bacterium]|nr:HAMP domain-containing sensor histidine kinase [Gaiellales bacterium]